MTTMDDAAPARPPRLTSVDMLRGLVIILMALDHTRDYFHLNASLFDPTDPQKSYLALYLTRWITHFCAPTFMLLAGVSAFLQEANGKSRARLSRFLLTRGLWLILLELTVVAYAWNFQILGIGLIVLWALGASMVALSGLVWLPRRAVLAIGVLLIAGHNLLDGVSADSLGAWGWLWHLLKEPGFVPPMTFVAYPVLPWIGVIALGYGLGPVFVEPAAKRDRTLITLGLAMIAAFLVVRGINLYGDPRPWTALAEPLRTVFSFFNVAKYPPSLDYVLITIGPMLALIPFLERLKGSVARVLDVYGKAPFMFYVAHIYLIHLAMLAGLLAVGLPAELSKGVLIDPSGLVRAGWGVPLWGVYLVWIAVVAALHPLCRWWGGLKRRRTDWWLSYL